MVSRSKRLVFVAVILLTVLLAFLTLRALAPASAGVEPLGPEVGGSLLDAGDADDLLAITVSPSHRAEAEAGDDSEASASEDAPIPYVPEEHAMVVQVPDVDTVDRAVWRGLCWLAEHQRADGSWDVFDRRPTVDDPPEGDVVSTSLAILAFLSDGHTATRGRHKDVVEKGVKSVSYTHLTLPTKA